MRRLDDTPLDPEIAASLEAIDATLAGDPVDPADAELAELALLLAAERPRPTAVFVGRLDERVQRRFVPVKPVGAKSTWRRRWWRWTPAIGLAAALVAAVVIVVGGGTHPATYSSSSGASAAVPAPARTPVAPTARRSLKSANSGAFGASAAATGAHATASVASSLAQGAVPPVEPLPSGRRVVLGAQLSLTTNATRIDDVAQEVFVVVGQVKGIVNNSTVTATGGPGGYAQFQLSIPSGSMAQAMAALSTLRYARVASRTDTTQDVTDQYQADVNQLADARARRASLLQQLANATTQGQIDSLTTLIHDTEAEISSDQATLASLSTQINYSQVTVTINGGSTPPPVQSGGGGFTFGKAAHDAGRVLTVAAGIALIGVAALVPFALVAALGWWIAAAIRRRRRENALDVV